MLFSFSDSTCKDPNGMQPHPNDCHKYIQCSNSTPHEMPCPAGTFFNPQISNCDNVANAPPSCK